MKTLKKFVKQRTTAVYTGPLLGGESMSVMLTILEILSSSKDGGELVLIFLKSVGIPTTSESSHKIFYRSCLIYFYNGEIGCPTQNGFIHHQLKSNL